jgi:hypothetical protein
MFLLFSQYGHPIEVEELYYLIIKIVIYRMYIMKRNFYLSVKGKLRVIGSLHKNSLSTLYSTFILRTVNFFRSSFFAIIAKVANDC